jgi:uncharacterized membrane protein SirB2
VTIPFSFHILLLIIGFFTKVTQQSIMEQELLTLLEHLSLHLGFTSGVRVVHIFQITRKAYACMVQCCDVGHPFGVKR